MAAVVKILQVHTSYREPGGEDIVVEAEAALLRDAGHEVVRHLATNPAGGPVSVAVPLARSAWNTAAADAVRRLAEQTRPDVAHVHNTWYALSPAVVRALRRLGVPVVMTLHNYRLLCANAQLFRDGRPCEDCVGTHPWAGVRHRCYHGSALLSLPAATAIALHQRLGTWRRDVDLFLAPSAFARSLFVRGGLPGERVLVKASFVDEPGARVLAAASSPTVLFVGRLEYQKGIDMLLAAWRRLSGTGLELVVVGDGPLRAKLERQTVAGVRFEGRLDAAGVRARMLAARALAFPSRSYEVQPMVVLEALAAGLPVLASGLGAMPDLLAPLGDGWLVPPGDEADWAAALRRLADPRLVERAGRRARTLYQQSFTPALAAIALEAAYELARHRAGSAGNG